MYVNIYTVVEMEKSDFVMWIFFLNRRMTARKKIKHRVKVLSLHIISLFLVELIQGRVQKWLKGRAK